MKKYTLEDFAPRNALLESIEKHEAATKREKPHWDRMEYLWKCVEDLQDQIDELTVEMQTKRSLFEVWKFRAKIAFLRSNIKDILAKLDDTYRTLIALTSER